MAKEKTESKPEQAPSAMLFHGRVNRARAPNLSTVVTAWGKYDLSDVSNGEMAKKKIRLFCRIVGTTYPLLSTSTGCPSQTVLGKLAFFKFMKLSVTHSYVMTGNELPMRQEIPLILQRSKAGIDSEQLWSVNTDTGVSYSCQIKGKVS